MRSSVKSVTKNSDSLSVRNRQNRDSGKLFEEMIETACEYYVLANIAEIEKTPEPRRVIGRTGGRNSQMICVNDKKAQPDYKGTLMGGRSVVFEAKHTEKDRVEQSRVSEEQTKRLDSHERFGAICFILVSFSYEKFFRISWGDWKRMKELYGRKYIKADDLTGKELSTDSGIIDFLESI